MAQPSTVHLDKTRPAPAASTAPDAAGPPDPDGGADAVLARLFAVLDRACVPYCLTHGYEDGPRGAGSDVDCLVPADVTPDRLVRLFHDEREALGARVVQRLDAESCYLVLASTGPDGAPAFVPLDVDRDAGLRGYVFYDGREVLEGRRRHAGGFWVPAPDVEFGAYLARKVAKGRLDDDHGRRLSALFARDPDGCRREVARLWRGADAAALAAAASTGDWSGVRANIEPLRARLLRGAALRHPLRLCWNRAAAGAKRLRRWCRPRHGLSVVVLGPDGAGKSSAVRSLARRWGPAFERTRSASFPPALRQRGPEVACTTPHEVPPRSFAASAARAVLYWFVYYGPGHYVTARPALARLTLLLYDRHLVDALVDPKRYRYTGPAWLLRLIWRLVPKPDLVILLDAPAAVIRSRKQEVPPEETERQCAEYRALVSAMPNGRLVDASQPPARVAADLDRLVLGALAARHAPGEPSPVREG